MAWLKKENLLDQYQYAATIQDYVVYSLTDLKRPVTDYSNAASWGIFDTEKKVWDKTAIRSLKLPKKFFPEIKATGTVAGGLCEGWADFACIDPGIPVYVAIGDNQASVLSNSNKPKDELYLTIGTGAQLSAIISEGEEKLFKDAKNVEIRPFIGNKQLAVAAPLCGGAAFAWLVDTVLQWCKELDIPAPEKDSLYKKFDKLGLANMNSPLVIIPSFLGERHEPDIRGSIKNIDLSNMTPGNVSAALARGIIENLYSMFPEKIYKKRKVIIYSGNAIRKLSLLTATVRNIFNMDTEVASWDRDREDAAIGAAMLTQPKFIKKYSRR